MAIDLFLMAVNFSFFYIIRYNNLNDVLTGINLPNLKESCFIFALWAVLIVIAFKSKRLYSTDRDMSIPKEMLNVVTRLLYVAVIIGSIIFYMKYKFFSRYVFCASFISLCVCLEGWRLIKRLVLRKLISSGFRNIYILIVGANKNSQVLLEEIKKRSHLGYKIAGFLDDDEVGFVGDKPILGKIADFVMVAQRQFIDEVIVTMPTENKAISELMMQAKNLGLGIRVVPEQLEMPLQIISIGRLGIIPLLTYQPNKPQLSETTGKNFFDFIMSAVLVILLSPLFLIVAIIIKISSSGPVFYTQKRLGVKGRVFNLYKFRSMTRYADEFKEQLLDRNEIKGGVMFKIKKDPRVTKIGRFLRKYSLDELPQLFNVLKGDMSLVGPRPPLPSEVVEYESSHMSRLSIKPGITGLSQVRGRSDLPFSRWVRWDLWYINNWSFWLDIKIILWTIPIVIKGQGAY